MEILSYGDLKLWPSSTGKIEMFCIYRLLRPYHPVIRKARQNGQGTTMTISRDVPKIEKEIYNYWLRDSLPVI